MFGEPHRVGGQRELVETVADQRAEAHGEGIDAAPHERLAAGQADTADAARDESLGKFGHFLDAEHRRFGQENHVFRSEEPTSELQSLMRISYAVFCLKKKK